MGDKKRLGIFVFYDKDGIVDNYISYLLEETNKILSRLIIVCNGYISPEGRERLSNFSKEIYVRKNEGFDGGAYKYVLTECMDRQEVIRYDELLLFNDTFYGPFYPWEYVFNKMDNKECDWWGLSKHEKALINNKRIDSHIQSYFMVIKKKVLCSDVFWNFWNRLSGLNTFDDTVEKFEIGFSNCMTTAGFTSAAFLKMERLSPQKSMKILIMDRHIVGMH